MAGSLPQSGVALIAQNAGKFLSDMRSGEGALGSFQRGAGAMSNIVTGAFRQVGAIITNVLAGAVRAVGQWLKNSVGVAGDFEQTLNVLGATSGATGAQLDQVAAKAKALGADLALPATSAQDAAQVMLELSKAGFSVEDSMNAAKGALQLSAAAQVDAAKAAEITAGAINAFGLAATDAVRVADLLAAGANASSASMTDLSQGLQQAGFMFHAVGMPIEDLVTSLAALTNVGLTGSDAGTALKNAITRLVNPTKKAAELMEKLGFSAYDANGKMKPLTQIITDLQGAFVGMTDEQKNAALGTIFLSDGMKAMIPLLGLGASGFNDLKSKVMVAGSAADVAGAQMKGWNGAVASTQSQMETLQLIIGTLLKNALTPLLFKVADAASKFTTWADSFTSAQGGLARFKSAIQGIITAFGLGSEGAALMQISLQNLLTTFGLTGQQAAIIQATISTIIGSIQSFVTQVQTAFSTGGITGVIGLVATNIVAALPGIVAAIGTVAAGIIATIGEQLPGIIDKLTTWRGAFLNAITPALPGVITSIGTLTAGVITAIGAALPGIIAALGRWALALLDWLLQASPGLLAALVNMGLQVIGAIGAALPGIVEALAQWGAKFVDWIIQAMPKLFATLLDLNAKVLAWIVARAPGILAKLTEWGARFVLWVVQTVPKLLAALGDMFAQLIMWIVGHRGEIAATLTKWGQAFVNWIGETAIPGILHALSDLWGQLSGWISETARKIGADDSVGSAIVGGIRKGISDAWDGLKRWFMGKIQGLLDSAKGLIGAGSPSRVWAEEFGKPISQGVALGIDKTIGLVQDSVGRMISAATAQAQNGLADISQVVTKMGQGKTTDKKKAKGPETLPGNLVAEPARKKAPDLLPLLPQIANEDMYHAIERLTREAAAKAAAAASHDFTPGPIRQTLERPSSPPAHQRPDLVTVQAPVSNTRTINMPVHTNQSPAVLSQSLALIEAITA